MTSISPAPWHSKFNLPALLNHAGQLRNVPCSCDLSQRPLSGSLNWVISLSFEDSVEWVFRSPTIGEGELSLEVAGELLESEVTTMKYIKLNSNIPVPEVFDYRSCTKFNAVGIPFVLMSKAPGTPLQDLRWDPHPLDKGIFPQRPHLSNTQKEKVMRQLGGIASQLSDLRFNRIGSLFEEAGECCIGKCLSPAFIFHDREILGDRILRGPFEHDTDYYEALLSAFLLNVQELRLQHNVFFAPVPILKDFKTSQSRSFAGSRWQDFVMAYRTPRDDADSVLDSAFKSGFIDHHFHGKETKLVFELWEHTRQAWFFTRLVVLDGLQDYHYFKDLYMSVYKPKEEISTSSLFRAAQKEDDLAELAVELADDDEWAPEILKDEEDYFAVIGQIGKVSQGTARSTAHRH